MTATSEVRAWRPAVPGVVEVFHARFTDHVYPMHSHAAWALLIVDAGAVRYDLDRHEHGALGGLVTLLPPDVPHNGRGTTAYFRKRVIYLDRLRLGEDLIGAVVDTPTFTDPALRHRIHQVHGALRSAGEQLEAESRIALICERLRANLLSEGVPEARADRTVAHRMRDLLDSRVVEGLALDEAAAVLERNPTHLIRAFSREFGMAPHQYLTSRRVDLARNLLLDGRDVVDAAVETGFYDQSHLTRHFKRTLGIAPGLYAAQARRRPA